MAVTDLTALWSGDSTEPPRLLDVLATVAHFLDQIGYHKTFAALCKEARRDGLKAIHVQSAAPLLSLYEQWHASRDGFPSVAPAKGAKGGAVHSSDDSDSDDENSGSDGESERDASEGVLVDVEAEETSDDESDEKSGAESDSDSSSSSSNSSVTSAKAGTKRKRILTPPSSDGDDSSNESSSDSDSDSGSSVHGDARPAKKPRVASSVSSSAGDSSSSDSDSSTSSSDSDSDSASKNDASSSDSDSSSSATSSPTPPPAKKSKKAQSSRSGKATDSSKATAPDAQSRDGGSQSSETLDVESAAEKQQESEESVQIHPDRLKRLPATEREAAAQQKKQHVPFSRIPADQKVDPRFASNEYVSYDYADRAYKDLSVTKGKGFTKEKNKKKRGKLSSARPFPSPHDMFFGGTASDIVSSMASPTSAAALASPISGGWNRC